MFLHFTPCSCYSRPRCTCLWSHDDHHRHHPGSISSCRNMYHSLLSGQVSHLVVVLLINLLACRWCRCNLEWVIFKLISTLDIFNISWEIVLRWMPQDWCLVNIGSGNGLVPSGNKALPEPTVETLYSTIYYSKSFIELNFDKSTEYVALWTHKRHPIPRPFGRAMGCLLWVLQQKLTVL